MPGSVTLQSNLITSQSGSKVIGPLILSGVGNILAVTEVAFSGASNVIVTPPAGATFAIIVPPSGNLVGLTMKGVAGDTGNAMQPGQAWVTSFANTSAPANFVIGSAGAVTGNVEITFF